MRQQANIPSSVISSHSMHLGVLATAWHAIKTGTMFTIYYKPRTSPTEFIVPYDQYMESIKNNYSIGMRFNMRFEGEEAPEQRFTGTIVGLEERDPKRWPDSKWKCLKVRWDETSTISRPDRVSPWKIEPALVPPAINPLPVHRQKRPRSNMLPSSPDSSVLTREGSSKVPVTDPSPPSAFSRVLQGQELSTLRGTFVDSNESDSCDRPIHWAPSVIDNEKVEGSLRGRTGESSFADLLSGFGSNNCSTNEFSTPSNEGKFNLHHSNPWPIIPSGLSLSLLGGGMKSSPQDVRFSAFDQYSVHGNQRGGGRMAPPLSSYLQMSASSHSSEVMPKSQLGKQNEIMKPKDGNCKIFGVPLAGNTNISDAAAVAAVGQRYLTFDCDQKFEQSKRLKVVENSTVGKEQHLQAKIQGVSTRSCTKVHKQGIALGRSVDLTKYNNYDELIGELDELFEFNGELKRPDNKNWLVVYTDDEGDMMLVGDDPWPEFCGMVRKMFIYTREEVQRMNPGTLNDDNSSVAEGMDEKDTRKNDNA